MRTGGATEDHVVHRETAVARHVAAAAAVAIPTHAYSPDGGAVATCLGEKIFLWDPEKGERRREIAIGQQAVFALVFAPSGKALASVGLANAVTLWDPATGEEIRRLKGDRGGVFFMGFRDGAWRKVSDLASWLAPRVNVGLAVHRYVASGGTHEK